MSVNARQSNSAKIRERWRDIRRRSITQKYSGVNTCSVKKYRHALIIRICTSMRSSVVGSIAENPVRFQRDDPIAAAPGKIAQRRRAQNRIRSLRQRMQLLRTENSRNSWRRRNFPDDRLKRFRLLPKFFVSSGGKRNIAVRHGAHCVCIANRFASQLIDLASNCSCRNSPSAQSIALRLLRNWRDAVIRAERHHVISASDFRVKMRKQFAQVTIQLCQNVLHFSTVRTRPVPDFVQRRKTHRKKIRESALPQFQR